MLWMLVELSIMLLPISTDLRIEAGVYSFMGLDASGLSEVDPE
jgi:hypothetical protein